MKKIIFIIISLFLMSGSISLFAQETKTDQIHPALLVIDMQKQYVPMMDDREKPLAMYAINAYIDLFRQYGYPVVRVYHTSKEYGPAPGTPEFEFQEDVKILPDDPKVIKTYADGFNKTDLEKVLRDKGANTLFLCGLSATGCVLATWIGAQDRDFTAFLLKDATLSHNTDYTNQVETIFDAVGYEAVDAILKASK